MSSNCTDDLATCAAGWAGANLTLAAALSGWADANASLAAATAAALAALPADDDFDCTKNFGEGGGGYDLLLHAASVFIVFMCSLGGVMLTLLGKVAPAWAPPPFAVVVGKTVGTGIILACALVHMLQPGNESLTSPCVPTAFNTDYNAYAFLFAMYAALFMQALEYFVGRLALSFSHRIAVPLASSKEPNATKVATADAHSHGHVHSHMHPPLPLAHAHESQCPADGSELQVAVGEHADHHAVMHLTSSMPADFKTALAAVSLEFGLTIHSVVIGLIVGTANNDVFRVLLVALCFHQFFEGVGLGARLVDVADGMHTRLTVALALVFAVAAPLGIGAGIGVAANPSYNPNGSTFLLTQGTFDSVCAGILLYTGFQLLGEFTRDLDRHCDGPLAKYGLLKRCALFVALWGGAGIMAYIGRYL